MTGLIAAVKFRCNVMELDAEQLMSGSHRDAGVTRLSLCMILKDEAFFLQRCLDATRDYVDEIVLVDTGSRDDTRDIGMQYADKVYDFEWIDDFAAARNYSLEQACGDWILVLDADELITAEDLAGVRELIARPQADVFLLRQLNYTNNTTELDWLPLQGDSEYGWDYIGYCVNPIARLFRNRSDIRYTGVVHEIIDLSPNTVSSQRVDIAIHHDIDGNPDKGKHSRQLKYLEIMEESLRKRPDGRLAALSGTVRMYHLEDYTGAIAHLRQAVELGYEPNRNLEVIAEAQYRLGEHGVALLGYEALYRSGYATAPMCNNYANLLVRAGNPVLAIKLLERGLTIGSPAPESTERTRKNISYLRRKIETSN
jgi:glycosyltransferase involved in cell wall biosynthesis